MQRTDCDIFRKRKYAPISSLRYLHLERARPMSKLNITSTRTLLALTAITIVAGTLASAFAWSAGWIGTRQTSEQLVSESPPHPFPPGFRRTHGKGVCFAGYFQSNHAATGFSTARAFSQSVIPIVGRFSIGTGNPHAADSSTATLSMALLLQADSTGPPAIVHAWAVPSWRYKTYQSILS